MHRIRTIGLICVVMLIAFACDEQNRGAQDRAAQKMKQVPQKKRATAMSPKPETADRPLREQDYAYAFWPNGFRKEKGDNSSDVFAVESGHYGFALDLADFRKVQLGKIEGTDYLTAGYAGAKPVNALPKADLKVEIEHNGKVYQAINCLAGRQKNPRSTIMMESGRLAQRFHFLGIQFEDANGKVIETNSMFELVAWPSSLTFTLKASPDASYADGPFPGIAGTARVVRGKPIDVPHNPKLDPQKFTLEFWVKIPTKLAHQNGRHWLIGKNNNEWAEGNFGVLYHRGNVSAFLNIGGGRKNMIRIGRHKAIKEDEWCHLAMTYDSKTMKLYVNGSAAGSKKIDKARTPGKDKLRIGGRPDGHGKVIHAIYDEVRIWNRALSPQEIRAHKNHPGGHNRKGLSWEMSFDAVTAGGAKSPNLDGATVRLSLNGNKTEKKVSGKWSFGKTKEFVLHCPMVAAGANPAELTFNATGVKGRKYTTKYTPSMAAHVIDIPKFDRDWKTGYTDIRKYDEVDLSIESRNVAKQYVPVLFDIDSPANITGNVPILCDADGKPTGIPVQLSKNWHHGAYAKYYAIIPVNPGETQYRLRIAYGFWGKLPSASHAQLSLWGYGGNGRWDQLAIGCWGETICFDIDNSLVDVMVTDVRMLMARNGLKGKKWGWTDAGWGGDWIAVKRSGKDKLMPTELKTTYLAHGPCLTDVHYNGYYGKNRDFSMDARIATLRTDDYSRSFQKFSYRFEKGIAANNSYLFRQGRTGGQVTPMIAYGNRDGLIAQHKVPGNLKVNSMFKENIVLTGPAPWWVAFPGARSTRGKDWGTGYRALIIRSFKAVHGGKEHNNPTIAFPVFQVNKKARLSNLDLYLTVPKGVTKFMPGDAVDMDLEWITLHRVAADYYGPNEAYRKHLAANPTSWKTTLREAVGNDLKITVTGGKLVNSYPVIVTATGPEVKVTIKGGVGAVPIRFEGLPSNKFKLYRLQGNSRKALDQSDNGNDFWQTDYDPASNTYKMTFNLPLDGIKESTWLLGR